MNDLCSDILQWSEQHAELLRRHAAGAADQRRRAPSEWQQEEELWCIKRSILHSEVHQMISRGQRSLISPLDLDIFIALLDVKHLPPMPWLHGLHDYLQPAFHKRVEALLTLAHRLRREACSALLLAITDYFSDDTEKKLRELSPKAVMKLGEILNSVLEHAPPESKAKRGMA
jgi:hypothetical protein